MKFLKPHTRRAPPMSDGPNLVANVGVGLAWLWLSIRWIFLTFVVGGVVVGLAISLAIFGNTGLPDPRAWPILQPLLANPILAFCLVIGGGALVGTSYVAHRVRSISGQQEKSIANLQLVDLGITEGHREQEDYSAFREYVTLDFKVRNIGKEPAFIKHAEIKVAELLTFRNSVEMISLGDEMFVLPSKSYDLTLAYASEGEQTTVDMSQAVAPQDVDRFELTVGGNRNQVFVDYTIYRLEVSLIYNETNQVLRSMPVILCFPFVSDATNLDGVFYPNPELDRRNHAPVSFYDPDDPSVTIVEAPYDEHDLEPLLKELAKYRRQEEDKYLKPNQESLMRLSKLTGVKAPSFARLAGQVLGHRSKQT